MTSLRTMKHRPSDQLKLVEVKPGLRFSKSILQDMLPDAETTLFFGKLYELNCQQLSALLQITCKSDLTDALFSGDHSTELQGYILEDIYPDIPDYIRDQFHDEPTFKSSAPPPKGEILPEVWKSLEVEVAQSIKDVAAKLDTVVGMMPGKQGAMLFQTMQVMNRRRPTIGEHKTLIKHQHGKENLLILDVSGSMTSATIRAIVDDVVALSYMANAHMAIVSNDTFYWQPGSYSVDDVLDKAQYGGTHYETLEPLFDRDWGVVITVADYDSSISAAQHLAATAKGKIDLVLDVSLVNRPTFLAECLLPMTDELRPILIGNSRNVLS